MPDDLKRTPLNDWHRAHGAKMVEFGGWEMPIQYGGILLEHQAVRERAGLFDVSHMGEVRVTGPDSLAFIQRLITNDAGDLALGQAQYTVMTNPAGGVIDDLLVYRLDEADYLLVVNAATTPKDVDWIRRQRSTFDGDLEIADQSSDWAQLAIQGPHAERILSRIVPADLASIRYYRSVWSGFGGARALVSRTGYTGEDGFEVYLPPELAPALADALLETGGSDGLVPTGLGARDTLRLEAGMLLYGSDMDEKRTPVEAGLSWLIKPDKGEFIGRESLVAQLENGTTHRLVGFKLRERGVPRHGYPLCAAGGGMVGEVTSGSFSPTLQEGIGLGYVPSSLADLDTELEVEVRSRRVAATVVKTPFYRRQR